MRDIVHGPRWIFELAKSLSRDLWHGYLSSFFAVFVFSYALFCLSPYMNVIADFSLHLAKRKPGRPLAFKVDKYLSESYADKLVYLDGDIRKSLK